MATFIAVMTKNVCQAVKQVIVPTQRTEKAIKINPWIKQDKSEVTINWREEHRLRGLAYYAARNFYQALHRAQN